MSSSSFYTLDLEAKHEPPVGRTSQCFMSVVLGMLKLVFWMVYFLNPNPRLHQNHNIAVCIIFLLCITLSSFELFVQAFLQTELCRMQSLTLIVF